MKVYIKRENWDGGIWMELPATEKQAENIYRQLQEVSVGLMIPFIGAVAEMGLITALEQCLIGETVFSDNHLILLNSLAEKIKGWDTGTQVLFDTALVSERPDTIEKVIEVLGHINQYTWMPEISTMEKLGMYLLCEKGIHLTEELAQNFNYELYGYSNMNLGDIMTKYGLVHKEISTPALKPDSDTISFGDPIFDICITSVNSSFNQTHLELPAKIEAAELLLETDYTVSSKIPYLDSLLPPKSTIEDLNCIAWQIWQTAEQEKVKQSKLLALLEATAPRTIDMALGVIRHYSDFETLPPDISTPSAYASYLLLQQATDFPKELHPYVHLSDYGTRNLNGSTLVSTSYNLVVKVPHNFAPGKDTKSLKLYNSLSLLGYWYDRESSLPVKIQGDDALSLMPIIREIIKKSMTNYEEQGLAEDLYSNVLKQRIKSMVPDVAEYAGELWGVLDIETYGELTHNEMECLRIEWKNIAEHGWGNQLMEHPTVLKEGELFIGFWDSENNDNLFLKTSDEFSKEFSDS